jgi:branched-chain amino acid transport system substrate-binding protein
MNLNQGIPVARVAITAILVVSVMGLVTPAGASGAKSRVAGGPPISIGQIVPITGPYAKAPGVYEQQGPKLAVREINAHGGINGRPLKLIVVDDRSTNAGGIAAFKQLTRTDHVAAIIGLGESAKILAMAPVVEQARIPMIIGGTVPATTHSGNAWVFRTRPNDIYANRALTANVVSTLHLSRIALVYEGGLGFEKLLQADLKELGVTPVTKQAYPVFATDLTAQVLAIKKSGSRALLASAGFASDFILLANQMHQIGLHVTLLGNRALTGQETLHGAGSLIYGTYAVTDYAAGQSPEAAAFDRYSRSTMHLPGDFASAYTYDGMQILARVMRKVGTNPQAIRRGILAFRGYRGAMGTYNFDRNGDGLHQYTVVQNVRGRLRVIKVLSF